MGTISTGEHALQEVDFSIIASLRKRIRKSIHQGIHSQNTVDETGILVELPNTLYENENIVPRKLKYHTTKDIDWTKISESFKSDLKSESSDIFSSYRTEQCIELLSADYAIHSLRLETSALSGKGKKSSLEQLSKLYINTKQRLVNGLMSTVQKFVNVSGSQKDFSYLSNAIHQIVDSRVLSYKDFIRSLGTSALYKTQLHYAMELCHNENLSEELRPENLSVVTKQAGRINYHDIIVFFESLYQIDCDVQVLESISDDTYLFTQEELSLCLGMSLMKFTLLSKVNNLNVRMFHDLDYVLSNRFSKIIQKHKSRSVRIPIIPVSFSSEYVLSKMKSYCYTLDFEDFYTSILDLWSHLRLSVFRKYGIRNGKLFNSLLQLSIEEWNDFLTGHHIINKSRYYLDESFEQSLFLC